MCLGLGWAGDQSVAASGLVLSKYPNCSVLIVSFVNFWVGVKSVAGLKVPHD